MEKELRSDNNCNNSKEIKLSFNNGSLSKLDESINQIIKRENFIQYEIKKRPVSVDGNNYLSTLYEIDVKGTTNEGDKEINIFVKHVMKLELFVIISVSEIYKAELFAYKELSKIFADLQDEANVPEQERFKMIKVYDESDVEIIILENINKNGYKTGFRMDVMSLSFAVASIKQLARFHGLSLVIREKRKDFFENNIATIEYPHKFNDQWQLLINSSKEVALENIDEELKDELEIFFKELRVKYPEYCTDESCKVCLCHGDYKLNNIMAKLNGGEVIDVIPIDYQLMHYGCPVFDFSFFIYTGTDRDFRKTHMSNLKDLYYETLSNFLKYFDLVADEIYPRKDFEKMYKEKRDFGLMMMVLFLPFFYTSADHAPDVSKDHTENTFVVDDKYKETLNALIEDYVESKKNI